MNREEAVRRQHATDATDATPGGNVRRIPLRQILQSDREVELAHEDAVYRLRLTAAGKLLLTK